MGKVIIRIHEEQQWRARRRIQARHASRTIVFPFAAHIAHSAIRKSRRDLGRIIGAGIVHHHDAGKGPASGSGRTSEAGGQEVSA